MAALGASGCIMTWKESAGYGLLMRYCRSGVRHPSCAPFRQLERISEYIGYIPTQRRTQRLDLMIPRFREMNQQDQCTKGGCAHLLVTISSFWTHFSTSSRSLEVRDDDNLQLSGVRVLTSNRSNILRTCSHCRRGRTETSEGILVDSHE